MRKVCKLLTALLCVAMLTAGCALSKSTEKITAWDIDSGKVTVIGKLGLPLGTVCTVTAISLGNEKGPMSLLKILTINNKPVVNPESVKLPYEIVSAHSDEIFAPNQTLNLTVYENAKIDGFPSNLPYGITWQDHGYGMNTYLRVVQAPEAITQPW